MLMNKALSVYQAKRKIGIFSYSLFRFLLLLGVCYLLLFPLFYLIISAIQDPASMMDATVVWVPKALSASNFKTAFEQLNYVKSLGFTLALTLVSAFFTLISCSMAGYGLARFNFRGKNLVFILVILIIIVPPQTTMMSTYLNFRFFSALGLTKLFGVASINMIGSPLTFYLPAILGNGIHSGLSIYIFRQFFLGQPRELEEAAKIDGCGIFRTYLQVMIPLSIPAIVTVTVFSIVWYWNDSFFSTILFSTDTHPLAVALKVLRDTFVSDVKNAQFTAQEQRGILAAASILCVVPPLLLYTVIQRKFVESIENSGIVG